MLVTFIFSLNLEVCQLYLKKGIIFTTNINAMFPEKYNTEEFLARRPGVNLINILQAPIAPTVFWQKITKSNCNQKKKLSEALLYDKFACKMLMKLTPGVYFINILCTAFALVDPESVKITVKSSVSFYAFGIYENKSCT